MTSSAATVWLSPRPKSAARLLRLVARRGTGINPGAPAGVVVNDLLDRTEVFPKRPSTAAGFTVAAAAHGMPGEFAAVAIVAINGLPIAPSFLASGFCDGGGFLRASIDVAADVLDAGDVFTIQSARLDLSALTIVFGDTVDVVIVP